MPSGSGEGDEQMGRRAPTLLTPQMGKLRHGAAGRGPLSKKGFGARRAAEIESANPFPWPSVSPRRLRQVLASPCVFGELFPGCVRRILQWLSPSPRGADLSPICPAPE